MKKEDVIYRVIVIEEFGKKRIVKWVIWFSSLDIIVKLEKRINYFFKKFKWGERDDNWIKVWGGYRIKGGIFKMG